MSSFFAGGGPRFKPTQHVSVTITAPNTVENQAITPVQAEKTTIIPTSGLVRVGNLPTDGYALPVRAFLADSAGVKVDSGTATHLRLEGGDASSGTNTYNLDLLERV